MLKNIHISSELKQVLIIMTFGFLLIETLTPATIGFVVLGGVLILLGKIPGPLIRNLITLILFFIYWLTYGKIIDPEVGLNFLTSILVIKMLEKENDRDSYMIFFGLLLLISAGSLFQKNIMYVFFFGLSFFILIQDFYRFLRLPSGPISLFKNLLWILPISALFFFFAPRLMNPFQIESSIPKEGNIGYTPDVNISAIESLSSNDQVVFRAVVPKQLPQEQLYWRGNIITFTDGWNWNVMPDNRPQPDFKTTQVEKTHYFQQRIKTFSRFDFFFGLDSPAVISNATGEIELGATHTLSQVHWQSQSRYIVYSELDSHQNNSKLDRKFIRTSLRPDDKEWINQKFKSEQLPDLLKEIQNYFRSEEFSFSLSPGKVESFRSFMQDKKIGFCSHYASALALILRTKKIPSRLVSGFLGGTFNKFAGFYQVSQNDAHVWVEAYYEGHWQRIDATTWIAPDRMSLGGEAFMKSSSSGSLMAKAFSSKQIEFIRNLQQWIIQWDFKFNMLLDELDYYGQDALLKKFNIKREWIMRAIPFTVIIFIIFYGLFLRSDRRKLSKSEYLWKIFLERMKKRGLDINLFSLAETEKKLKSENSNVNQIWAELVKYSFSSRAKMSYLALKKKIKSL